MSRPVRVDDVVVSFLTENTARMLTQAIRLLRSIRWFGGELAGARVVVCGVGPLESRAREMLEELGAEIRTVSRFHPTNPTGNRHQMLAELLDAPEEVLFLLDCDTVVVQDPLPFLSGEVLQGKIAPTPTVSDEVFERLFAHFGLTKPARSFVAPFSGTPTIPYFNAGVLAIPKGLARTLAPSWRRFNLALAEHPELVAPCQRHMHQASLSLALAATGVPVRELPAAMNFQINATHVTPPAGYPQTDPVIVHYHHLASDDGFLLPCPYPGAQARIERFHERLRAEGFVQPERVAAAGESRPIVVLGMHRSGTSLVAQLLHAMGVYAGAPDELMPPDMFNPTGYWEHEEVVKIDTEILDALDAKRRDLRAVEVSRLSGEERAEFVAHAGKVVQSFQGRGPFLLKDPRMSLLFPLWHEVLTNPVCVIVWREPEAVARSLARRDRRPILRSLAVWNHYNRRLLRDTEGLPRALVSYEELLADPMPVARRLRDALAGLGIEGLCAPSEERMRQIVKPDFNRSGCATTDDSWLDEELRTLRADLRSGAALRGPMAQMSTRLFELVTTLDEIEDLRREVMARDQLLGAVFESRSWRLGRWLTGLVRLIRPGALTAEDRWRRMRERRGDSGIQGNDAGTVHRFPGTGGR